MSQEFNQYQIAALQQLAEYRSVFKSSDYPLTLKTKPVNGSKLTLQQFIDSFIEIFCQHNLADSDYSVILQKPSRSSGFKEWVNTLDISAILQALTYAIWTDKTFNEYFLRKINDSSVELLLTRLYDILAESYRQQQLQRTKVTVINTVNAGITKKQ